MSKVIKAMNVAKHSCNLGVILEFFRMVLESLPEDFKIGEPPLKAIRIVQELDAEGFGASEQLDRSWEGGGIVPEAD